MSRFDVRVVGQGCALFAAALVGGCQSQPLAADTESDNLGSVTQASTFVAQPGTPAAACCHFAEMLSDGSMRYAVTFKAPQKYVEVFVRQNGIQNVAKNIVASQASNADGTYTYEHKVAATQYRSGDKVLVRFYSYEPNKPGVFTPGPAEAIWATELTYGSASCFAAYQSTDLQCAASQAAHDVELSTRAYLAGTGSLDLVSAAIVKGLEPVARELQSSGQLAADDEVATTQLSAVYRDRAVAGFVADRVSTTRSYTQTSADQALLQAQIDYLRALDGTLPAGSLTTLQSPSANAGTGGALCPSTHLSFSEKSLDPSGVHQELLDATKQMQETQMSFNLQYLQLQSQMQNENRSYTAISNIMKTKHDTVKNSISNIR